MAYDELSEPVRAAVREFVGVDNPVIGEVEAKDKRGVVEYEVKGGHPGGRFVVDLLEDATITEARMDVAWDDVDDRIRTVVASVLQVDKLTDEMIRSCRRRFEHDRPIRDVHRVQGRLGESKFEMTVTNNLVVFGFSHGRKRQPGPVTNTICPVSGELINPEDSVIYNGRVIAFHEKSPQLYAFASDPEAFLDKLPELPAEVPDSPVNTACPVSGRELNEGDGTRTLLYDGQVIAFRSGDHMRKFLIEPDRYAIKLPE
jgi:hypothetical protein